SPFFPGRGTGNDSPGKPAGTMTGSLNCGSLDAESTRNSFDPVSLQASSGTEGHCRACSTGSRTSVARGYQSPATPLVTTRNLSGPNAEKPNVFAESKVATATLLSESV